VGGPIKSIEALQDIDPQLQQRLFYVVFEHLMAEPQVVLNNICQWLGLLAVKLDWQNLNVKPHESDSYYRYKYRHRTYSSLSPPQIHSIPQRIQAQIYEQFPWFYQTFYPGLKPQN
jgi:sulfotransferase